MAMNHKKQKGKNGGLGGLVLKVLFLNDKKSKKDGKDKR